MTLLKRVFSCKCCEIFKNISFEKHLRTATSVYFQIKSRIQDPAVKYLRRLFKKLLARCLTVQNTSLGKKAFTGVDGFLSRRPTFQAGNFTCTPDRARKK